MVLSESSMYAMAAAGCGLALHCGLKGKERQGLSARAVAGRRFCADFQFVFYPCK